MAGLAHVIMHVGLCNAAAALPAQTTLAVHAAMVDVTSFPRLDHTYKFERGYDPETIIEFDAPWGTYHISLDMEKPRCGASDFLIFLKDRNREITENLRDGPALERKPVLLFGTAPPSFTYVKPTFALFDKTATCNKPVGQPLPAHIVVENDRDAYYTWLYSDPALDAQGSAVVALRLRTPTGLYHYVHVPFAFPMPWHGWPQNIQFNVTEDQIDGLATQPADTLLCPKLWETTVH